MLLHCLSTTGMQLQIGQKIQKFNGRIIILLEESELEEERFSAFEVGCRYSRRASTYWSLSRIRHGNEQTRRPTRIREISGDSGTTEIKRCAKFEPA